MNNKSFVWFIGGFVCAGLVFILGCSQKKGEQVEALAKVNDYTMSVDDFREEVRHSPHFSSGTFDKAYLLDMEIKKQILIQEAQRQGLDRKKSFMKTIERYWEQTLIKELLNEEFKRITQEVPKDKQEEAMNDWMDALYKSADVSINKKVLEEIKLEVK